jgi:hypothetical protein
MGGYSAEDIKRAEAVEDVMESVFVISPFMGVSELGPNTHLDWLPVPHKVTFGINEVKGVSQVKCQCQSGTGE